MTSRQVAPHCVQLPPLAVTTHEVVHMWHEVLTAGGETWQGVQVKVAVLRGWAEDLLFHSPQLLPIFGTPKTLLSGYALLLCFQAGFKVCGDVSCRLGCRGMCNKSADEVQEEGYASTSRTKASQAF